MNDASVSQKSVEISPESDVSLAIEKAASVPEKLDAEVLAAIDEGIRMSANGRVWTRDEAFEIARSRRDIALATEQDWNRAGNQSA